MFVYIKNNKIVWASTDWSMNLWEVFEVKLEWYYVVRNWKPVMITSERDLPFAFFVWQRNRDEFYEKRRLCVEWTKEEEEYRKKVEENAKKWLDADWNPLKKEEDEEIKDENKEEQK